MSEMTIITSKILDSRLYELRAATAKQRWAGKSRDAVTTDGPVSAEISPDQAANDLTAVRAALWAYEDALYIASDPVIAWHLLRMAARMLYKGTPG